MNDIKQLLIEMNNNFNKRFDELDQKIDDLSKVIQSHHQENIQSDELLLNEVRSLKTDIVFVNRKVADTELTLNRIRQDN